MTALLKSSWIVVVFYIILSIFTISIRADVIDQYLYVDTHASASATGNVVAAGIATEFWVQNQEYEHAGRQLPMFYMWLNGSTYTSLTYTITTLLGSEVELDIQPPVALAHKRDSDSFNNNYTAISIQVKKCNIVNLDTRQLVTVDIRASLEGYEKANISFYRYCIPPNLNLGTTNNANNIYSFETGQVRPLPFSTDNNQVSASMYLWAPQYEPNYANGNKINYQLSASSNDSTLAVPEVSSGIQTSGNLTVGTDGYVDIFYTYGCLPDVVANVTFSLTITYGFPNNVTISWWKVCGAAAGPNPPPLNINGCVPSLHETNCLVANTSGVQDIWSGKGNHGKQYYYRPQLLTFDFEYVTPAGLATLDCALNFDAQNPSIAYLTNEPRSLAILEAGRIYKATMNTVCKAPGNAGFQCAVNCNTTRNGIPTNYSAIEFYFNMQCALPLIDVSTQPNHDVPDLIHHSQPLPGNSTVAQVKVQSQAITIRAWLPPIDLTPQNFTAVYLNLSTSQTPPLVNVVIDRSQINTTPLDGETSASDVAIPVSFLSSQPLSGIVGFQFFYGWENPINFYIELGEPLPSGGGGDGGGGLSGAAIFFIVFFVLLFVFCVAGSLFNYYNRGKRGWPIVPGYTTCQSCYDKAMGPNRYTPQMDYDRTFKTGGYGTYGTTGGDSYQSNL